MNDDANSSFFTTPNIKASHHVGVNTANARITVNASNVANTNNSSSLSRNNPTVTPMNQTPSSECPTSVTSSPSGVTVNKALDNLTKVIANEATPERDNQREPERMSVADLSKSLCLQDCYIINQNDNCSQCIVNLQDIFDKCVQSGAGPMPEAVVAFLATELLNLFRKHGGWVMDRADLNSLVLVKEQDQTAWSLKYRSSGVTLQNPSGDKYNTRLSSVMTNIVALLLMGIEIKDEGKDKDKDKDENMMYRDRYLKDIVCSNLFLRQRPAWSASFSAMEQGQIDFAVIFLGDDANVDKAKRYFEGFAAARSMKDGFASPLPTTSWQTSPPTRIFHNDGIGNGSDGATMDHLNRLMCEKRMHMANTLTTPTNVCKSVLDREAGVFDDKKEENIVDANVFACSNFISNHNKGSSGVGTPKNPFKYGRIVITIDDSDSDIDD